MSSKSTIILSWKMSVIIHYQKLSVKLLSQQLTT